MKTLKANMGKYNYQYEVRYGLHEFDFNIDPEKQETEIKTVLMEVPVKPSLVYNEASENLMKLLIFQEEFENIDYTHLEIQRVMILNISYIKDVN